MTTPCKKCGATDRNASGQCRPCRKAYADKSHSENPLKRKEYVRKLRDIDPQRFRDYNKKWYDKNKDKRKITIDKWREGNPDKCRAYDKKYKAAHPEKARLYAAKQISTPQGAINNRISTGMYRSLVSGAKNGRHWETLVDYNVSELKAHLERLFVLGMTWDNRREWHIDHIIPLSAFNFSSPDDIDFKRCWALKNLRPMWARENLIKQDNIPKPFQPSLALKV